jgi:hypothetical protein
MPRLVKAEIPLRNEDIEKLQEALGIIPDKLNGQPYIAKCRRGEIERRRLSLVKADKPAPNQCEESQELFKLCRWKRLRSEFVTVGWALRSRVSGDYFVYSEVW